MDDISCMHATVQVSPGGRVVIPAKMRQALHLADGSRMVVTFDTERRSLVLIPVDEALDRLQDEAAVLLGNGLRITRRTKRFRIDFLLHKRNLSVDIERWPGFAPSDLVSRSARADDPAIRHQ